MKSILSKIYLVYVFFWVLFFFLLLYPLFWYYLSDEKRYTKAHKLRVLWGRLLLITCLTRKEIYFEEPFDKNKLYVIIANHSSFLDIATLAVALPVDFNYIAKIELARIPVFGIFFRTIDIAVDRKSPIQSAKAYMRANLQLKNKVKSIVIFPEGGIKKQAPKLSPFKEGAFKMAIENKVYILPVSMPDNHKRLYSENNGASPGMMRVYIHKPIDTSNMKVEQVKELTNEVFHIINSKL